MSDLSYTEDSTSYSKRSHACSAQGGTKIGGKPSGKIALKRTSGKLVGRAILGMLLVGLMAVPQAGVLAFGNQYPAGYSASDVVAFGAITQDTGEKIVAGGGFFVK